jgi:hypothetical protein
MKADLRRNSVLGLLGVAATVVVGLAAAAYACTNLSTINLSSGSARPGDKITATGTSFGGGGCGCRPRGVSPVEIHWNGRNGTVVAEANADTVGNISATFSVPDAKPGFYTIVATQRDLELNMDYYGTPAIASFEVLGPHGESVVRPSSEGVGSATSSSDSAGLVALTAALGVLSLGLFGGGAVTAMRALSRRRATATVGVRAD